MTPTRFPELHYIHVDGYNVTTKRRESFWRFVDASTGHVVGPAYPTKAEMLADLTRYAAENWGLCDAPTPQH